MVLREFLVILQDCEVHSVVSVFLVLRFHCFGLSKQTLTLAIFKSENGKNEVKGDVNEG